MKWKEFFKPTIGKIILLIVILILTFFIPKNSHELCEKGLVPTDLSLVSCYKISEIGIGYPIFYGERFLDYVRTLGSNPFE